MSILVENKISLLYVQPSVSSAGKQMGNLTMIKNKQDTGVMRDINQCDRKYSPGARMLKKTVPRHQNQNESYPLPELPRNLDIKHQTKERIFT